MSEFGGDHAQISAVFLRRSRVYLSGGELLQASEKGWGAAAHAAKTYAAARRISYVDHSEFSEVMTELRLATNRHAEIQKWASSANALHRNFYNDNFTAPQIASHLDNVANLVNLIRQLTDLPPVDH